MSLILIWSSTFAVAQQPVTSKAIDSYRAERLQIETFFDSYQQATSDDAETCCGTSGESLLDRFDFEKLFELSTQVAGAEITGTARQELIGSLAEHCDQQLRLNEGSWSRHEILSVAFSNQGKTAKVLLRRLVDNQSIRVTTFMLHKAGDEWRIFDRRDERSGLSMVVLGATLISSSDDERLSEQEQVTNSLLTQAAYALWQGRQDDAVGSLHALTGRKIPEFFERIFWTYKVFAATNFQDYLSLHYLEKLVACAPDLPMADLLRAKIHNALDHPDLAIKYANRYIDRLGDDADAYAEIGKSYERLGRTADCVKAFENALKACPGSVRYLWQLSLALPDNSKSLIAVHFADVPDKASGFRYLANVFQSEVDLAAMESLIDAMGEHDPDEELLAYYRGWMLNAKGRYKKAYDIITNRLGSIDKESEYRDAYLQLAASLSVLADQALEYYDSCEDPEVAFDLMLSSVLELWRYNEEIDESHYDSVASVIAKHLSLFPDDIDAARLLGDLEFFRQNEKAADKHYANAITALTRLQPDDSPVLGDLVSRRIDCYDRMQQLSEAYASIKPKSEVFVQLFDRWIHDEESKQKLESLFMQRATDAPESSLLLLCKSQYQLQEEHYEQVIASLKPWLKRIDTQELSGDELQNYDSIADLYARSLIRAGQAKQAIEASNLITDDFDRAYMSIIAYAANGDNEMCSQILTNAQETLAFDIEYLVDDPDLDDLSAFTNLQVDQDLMRDEGVPEGLPDLENIVLLLPAATSFDILDLPRAVEAAWQMQLPRVARAKRTVTKGDHICQLNADCATISVGDYQFYVSKAKGKYVEGEARFFEGLVRAEESLVQAHEGWLLVEAIAWPSSPSDPIGLPPVHAQRMVARLAAALAKESATVAFDTMNFVTELVTDDFLDDLRSDYPGFAFKAAVDQ